MTITASSSAPAIIPHPSIAYTPGQTNGTLTFAPIANASGTATITVIVADTGGTANGGVHAVTNTFNVTVTPVNDAPVLQPIANQTVNEGTLLNVSALASDIDNSAAELTFSLDPGAPAGMSIDARTGAIQWIPTEAQGPGAHSVTARVTDSGTPAQSATRTFVVGVNEVNVAPALAAIEDTSLFEGSLFRLAVIATDADLPVNTLTYSLDPGAPAGALIDPATGVLTWTPSEAQAPGTFSLTVRVSDDGAPNLSATRTFRITTFESNSEPVLDPISDRTVTEGTPLVFNVVAIDRDLPANSLTFTLRPGAPAGAQIGSSSGTFSWTPSEEQGPGTYPITVEVRDDGQPSLQVVRTFQVTVQESNDAPVIAAIPEQLAEEEKEFSFTISATDPDRPANQLTFALGPNAPAGARIDSATGLFSWTPTEAQGPGTFPVEVRVSDNGSPAQSAARTFAVRVAEANTPPALAAISDRLIAEGSTLAFAVSATDRDLPPNTLRFALGTGAPSGAALDPITGLFTWAPSEAQGPSTNSITVQVTDDATPALSSSRTFQVIVTESNGAPLLADINDQVVNEGETLTLRMTASDPDQPPTRLTFSLGAAPAGMTIDPALGVLAWRAPQVSQETSHEVAVVVADSGSPSLSTSKRFKVTVRGVNDAPVISPISNQTTRDGTSTGPIVFRVSDPDSPAERISISAKSANVALVRDEDLQLNGSGENRTITLKPIAGRSGSAVITITAVDSQGARGVQAFTLEVQPAAPVIATRRAERTVRIGTEVQMQVQASGTEPVSYQWLFNETDLPGATGPTLTVSNVSEARAGRYRVRVANAAGSTFSEAATLGVSSLVQLTLNGPSEIVAAVGDPVTLSVTAIGTEPITYEWFFDSQPIPGATGSSLIRPAVTHSDAGRYRVVARNPAGSVPSPEIRLTVIDPLVITRQPESQVAKRDETATFTVAVSGTGPFMYSWEVNGTPFRETSTGVLTLPGVQSGAAGTYRVRVKGAAGSVASDTATLTVLGPPSVTPLPSIIRTNQTADVVLSVTAQGTPPFRYQWIRNGVNIPGATNSTYIIRNIQPEDGGNYSVVVTDAGGAITSNTCSVQVITPPLPSGDNLADASISTATEGTFSGSNAGATREPGEPSHAPGRPPRKSVWFGWQAPGTGIVRFDTGGSGFDTIVAVYHGRQDDITSLRQVASDGDSDSGSYLTSQLAFNTEAGATYFAAVDGFEGVEGNFVVRWKWEETGKKLPIIVQQPLSQTVLLGQDITFSVSAQSPDNSVLAYQWYFDGEQISGATSASYTVRGVRETQAGNYRVKIRNVTGSGREVESHDAVLQINIIETGLEGPGIEAIDKIAASSQTGEQIVVRSLGLMNSGGSRGASARNLSSTRPSAGSRIGLMALTAAPELGELRGFRGSKVFSTKTAVKDAGEPNHCHLTGGASVWFVYHGVTNATMRFSTEGSDYDTVLAVYTGPSADYATMEEVVCDNNSGADGKTSVVQFATVRSKTYYLAIDGVEGAKGLVRFKYEVAAPPIAGDPPVWGKVDPATCALIGNASNPNVGPGDSVQFSVAALNPLAAVDLTYQWRRNGLNILDGFEPTLCLKNLTSRDIGEYAVVVGNFSGSVTSAPIRLDFSQPLALLEPLADQSVIAGENARFAVLADGTGPFAYRWTRNGVPLPEQSSSTLVLNNVQASQAGEYAVQISNGTSSTSSRAMLRVVEPAMILVQPEGRAASIGSTVQLQVTAGGTAPLTYQWFFNGAPISGASRASFTIEKFEPSLAGHYRVVVGNAARSVVSDIAAITLNAPLSISVHPVSQTVPRGSQVLFSVVANGVGIRYQWRFNGAPIAGAAGPALELNRVELEQAGIYDVLLSGDRDLVLSGPAILTVQDPTGVPPRIVRQPADKAVKLGESASFSVVAEGSAPLRYQWRFNGQSIAGATNATYTIAGAALAHQGRYQVTVSNTAGSARSVEAALCVLENNTTVRFMSVNMLPDQTAARVLICGCSGTNATLQGTFGFKMWSVLTNFTFRADNLFEYFDSEAPRNPWRLYQVAPPLPVKISTHPIDQAVAEGSTARLEVKVEGTGPFTYQWRFNGSNLPNATNAVLTLTNVQSAQHGAYDVRVANGFSRALSLPGQLCVLDKDHAIEIISVRLVDQRATSRVLICGPTPNQKGALYASEDAKTWKFLTHFTIGANHLAEHLDRDAARHGWRFYRVQKE